MKKALKITAKVLGIFIGPVIVFSPCAVSQLYSQPVTMMFTVK